MQHLHASTQALLRIDGQWLRCKSCDQAFWWQGRDEAFIGPRIRKHVRKAHVVEAVAKSVPHAPKRAKAARRPNPPKAPTSDPLSQVAQQLELALTR